MDFDMRDAEKLRQERRRLRKARAEKLEEFNRLYGALDEEDKAKVTAYMQGMLDNSDYRRDTEEPHIIEFKRAKSNIKRFREKLGLTQEELAEKLGVTQASVSMWENEKASPRMPLLKRMAKIFACNVDDLVANSTETQDPTEAV